MSPDCAAPALQHTRHRAQMALDQHFMHRRIVQAMMVLQQRQAGSAVAQRAGDKIQSPGLAPARFSARPAGTAMNAQRQAERPARGIAADQLHIVIIQQLKQAVAERRQPGSSTSGNVNASVNHAGSAPIAAVAQVNRQRFVAEIGRMDIT